MQSDNSSFKILFFHQVIHYHKFIAASTIHPVTKRLPQIFCRPAYQLISSAVSEIIINLFQPIQIKTCDTQMSRVNIHLKIDQFI